MTNEEKAIILLEKHGLSSRLDADNRKEVKKTIIEALNLADAGQDSEARKRLKPVERRLQEELNEILREIAASRKRGQKTQKEIVKLREQNQALLAKL